MTTHADSMATPEQAVNDALSIADQIRDNETDFSALLPHLGQEIEIVASSSAAAVIVMMSCGLGYFAANSTARFRPLRLYSIAFVVSGVMLAPILAYVGQSLHGGLPSSTVQWPAMIIGYGIMIGCVHLAAMGCRLSKPFISTPKRK